MSQRKAPPTYEVLIEALFNLLEMRRRYEKRHGAVPAPFAGVRATAAGGPVRVFPAQLAATLLRKGGLPAQDEAHLQRIVREHRSDGCPTVLKALPLEDAAVLGLKTMYLEDVYRSGWLHEASEKKHASTINFSLHVHSGLDNEAPDVKVERAMRQEAIERGYDGIDVTFADERAADPYPFIPSDGRERSGGTSPYDGDFGLSLPAPSFPGQ